MNEVTHIEIPVLDLKRAKEFYSNIFDWKVDIESLPKYALVNGENGVSIGMPLVEELSEIKHGIYFNVENIPQKLDEIRKHGGDIVQEKTEITPEIGYSGRFRDCFGNNLRLFSRN